MSEIDVQNSIRLSISKTGKAVALRNNTGLFLTLDATRKVQAGLGKGTADLIGFIEHEVTAEDVGRKIAIFAAFEVKTAKGRASTEQEAFLAAVVRRGGVAGIVRSPADAESLVLEKWDSKLLHKKD